MIISPQLLRPTNPAHQFSFPSRFVVARPSKEEVKAASNSRAASSGSTGFNAVATGLPTEEEERESGTVKRFQSCAWHCDPDAELRRRYLEQCG